MREDPRYLKGIEHYNNEDFFEAHEEWEALWHDTRGSGRDFIQGLIQVTSAYHHFHNGNLRGARILFDSGKELLAPYGDAYEGLPLNEWWAAVFRTIQPLTNVPLEKLPGRGHAGEVHATYTTGLAPKITLRS